MSKYKAIKEKFNQLPPDKKETLLKDIYYFSKDMQMFLEGRLLGEIRKEFVEQMKKETIGKVYKKGIPGTPNGRVINSIILKAKKSNVDIRVLLKLEKLAYRGFIEFLNEYGGGPDNFIDMGCDHLETYLKLVKNEIKDKSKQKQLFQDVKDYLLAKNNMLTDYVDDAYEEVTGIPIKRNT